jgi:hypothetical protein
MGYMRDAREVAHPALFLAFDDANYFTGVELGPRPVKWCMSDHVSSMTLSWLGAVRG